MAVIPPHKVINAIVAVVISFSAPRPLQPPYNTKSTKKPLCIFLCFKNPGSQPPRTRMYTYVNAECTCTSTGTSPSKMQHKITRRPPSSRRTFNASTHPNRASESGASVLWLCMPCVCVCVCVCVVRACMCVFRTAALLMWLATNRSMNGYARGSHHSLFTFVDAITDILNASYVSTSDLRPTVTRSRTFPWAGGARSVTLHFQQRKHLPHKANTTSYMHQ